MTPLELVQGQLDAYNARDLDRFCGFYSDDIIVHSLSDSKMLSDGKNSFRELYRELFESSPNLHSRLVNRMHLGDFVVDQEEVVGIKGTNLKAIALYQISDGKISRVWFILEHS